MALLIGVPLLIVSLPFMVIGLLAHVVSKVSINMLAWCWWCTTGRCVLLVYSDSVIWKDYFEKVVLPAIRDEAVILNVSHRRKWRPSLAVWAFHHYAGRVNYNPAAFVFRPLRRVETLRYYMPFKEWKRGHPESVEALTARLLQLAGSSSHAAA